MVIVMGMMMASTLGWNLKFGKTKIFQNSYSKILFQKIQILANQTMFQKLSPKHVLFPEFEFSKNNMSQTSKSN